MSVAELATLLKQYEMTMPGRDVLVQMTYDVDEEEHTALVPLRDFRWGTHGAVVTAEDVA